MSALHVNEGSFETVLTAPVALVDFWASWCGPCKMVGPTIDALADQYEGKAIVAKVDVDSEGVLASRYGVMSIPTVIIFKDGVEVERKVGAQPQAVYAAVIDENL